MRLKNAYFSQLILRACGIGSMFAALCLVGMSIVSRSFSREEQVGIWLGNTTHDLLSYSSHFSMMYAVVSAYLIGHFLMWLGYSFLAGKRAAVIGTVILLIGFLSSFADLTEYGLRGAMLKGQQWQIHSAPALPLVWWFIRELSIWLIYLGSVVIGISLLNQAWESKFLLVLALLGLCTIPCLYITSCSKIWFAWLVAWHLASGFTLWRSPAWLAESDER
jgi:hypothetical protein